MKSLKVAVSGVGGGVGQGIVKALSISSLPVVIYPVDVNPLAAGLFRGEGALLPKPETPNGIDEWERYLVSKGIDVLIPGSDYDLLPLAAVRDDWLKRNVCNILVSDLDLIRICRDKAITCQRLMSEGIPVPKSIWDLSLDESISWAEQIGYPIIIKPRSGSASRDIHIVKDEEELRFFIKRTPSPILQEYLNLNGKAEEFTCAVFVDKKGEPICTFMARRTLSGGSTYRAEINFWPEIQDLLLDIGRALRPKGPLNVQLRLTERGPIPFEINIRCSGTAPIRAFFGYNEPEMMLRHYILGEVISPPATRYGYALRYWNEVFLEGVSEERLMEGPKGLTGVVLKWP